MAAQKSPREEQLVKEGWTKQFCASSPRLEEAAEIYRSMGLVVHLEPAQTEDLGCSECLVGPSAPLSHCFVIYTRSGRKTKDRGTPDTPKQDEDLW